MAQDNSREVTMVPVKRYDVTLTLDEILTPLGRTSGHLAQARMLESADQRIPDLLERFTQLVAELNDVVSQINQIDPTLLASKPGPPPGP